VRAPSIKNSLQAIEIEVKIWGQHGGMERIRIKNKA
jgi:hypothetical protein